MKPPFKVEHGSRSVEMWIAYRWVGWIRGSYEVLRVCDTKVEAEAEIKAYLASIKPSVVTYYDAQGNSI